MKKFLSIVLTVCLMLTIVPMGAFSISASADDSVAVIGTQGSQTEIITIGSNSYKIESSEKYSAYDEVMSVINNATLNGDGSTDGYTVPYPVSFTGAWDVNFKLPGLDYGQRPGPYGTKLEYCNTYGSAAPGLQLVSIRSNDYARLAVGKYDSSFLWISPCSSEGEDSRAKITFTADRSGKVVLWDESGKMGWKHTSFSLSSLSSKPWYMWQDSTTEIAVEIHKNGTKIWPLNGEDNVFTSSKKTMTFPDLGEISVAQGDKIEIVYIQNNASRAGMLCSPMVAYVATDEEVTIGDSVYKIITDEKYSAYDEVMNVINGATLGDDVTFNGPWEVAFGFQGTYVTDALKYKYTGVGNGIQSTNRYAETEGRMSVGKHNSSQLWFSPGSYAANSNAKFSFTATRSGKIVLWDKNGAITNNGLLDEAQPYYFWNKTDTVIQMFIYKNSELLWPKNGEANTFTATGNTIAFPDLGLINVKAGDEIHIEFIQNNGSQRAAVLCSPMVAYVASHEKITVGNSVYNIIIDEKYCFRDDFFAAIDGLETSFDDQDKMPVVYFDGDWSIAIDNIDKDNKPMEQYSQTFFYRQSDVSGFYMVSPKTHADHANGIRESIAFKAGDTNDKNLYYGVGTIWGHYTEFSYNYTAPHNGKLVVFDAINTTINALSESAPHYSFQKDSTLEAEISIWKNDTIQLWPKNGSKTIINYNNRTVSFPDAGEITVKAGDVITVKVKSKNTGGAGGVITLNPAVAYTEIHEERTSGYYTYEILKDKAIITACDPSISGDVTIPDELDGYPVTGIGDSAFYNCAFIESVTIPNSVKTIGNEAFCDCTLLKSVTIPNGVTSIGNYAFSECTSLTSIIIPNSITSIGNFAFNMCDSLVSVVIPNGITNIGEAAFYWCRALKRVAIPSSVTSVGESAFYWCDSLKNVYYSGSESEWSNVAVSTNNNYLSNATMIYNATQVPHTYTITWNVDGNKTTTQVDYGEIPVFTGSTEKPADNTYTYEFIGWDSEVTEVESDKTYTAVFKETFIDYTVTFKDWDGTVLSETTYHYGDTVAVPSTPTRPDYNGVTYEFIGWGKEVSDTCVGDAVYTAVFKETLIDYVVTFKDWDGTVLSTNTYHYGDTVAVPSTPTRPDHNGVTYTFIGWDSDITSVASDKIYIAVYSEAFIDYTVTFKDWDGTVLSENIYHYGDTVTVPSAPTRPSQNGYIYTFIGWGKDVAGSCVGDAVYTAQYQEVLCAHANTELKGSVSASCTQVGHTGETWCKDCEIKLSDSKEIPMLPHNYEIIDGKLVCGCGNERDVTNALFKEGDYFYIDNVCQNSYQLIEYDGGYYFINDYKRIAKNTTLYLRANFLEGTGLAEGYYTFDNDGKMIVKSGVVDDYFYINGVRQNAYQLVQYEGVYYFIYSEHKIAKNITLYMTNQFLEGTGLLEGNYTFDENGKMILKNGIIDDYYYINNVRQNAYQLVQYEGAYYFIYSNHKIAKNITLYMTNEFVGGTGLPEGNYTFDENGKMLIKNGIIDDYYYVNNIRQNAYQLVQYEGAYYFIYSNHKIAKNITLYMTNEFVGGTGLAEGYYTFDENGKMIVKSGVVDDYLYINGIRQEAYQLVEFDGGYYFISTGNKVVKNKKIKLTEYFVGKYGLSAGEYEFDANGKMILQ